MSNQERVQERFEAARDRLVTAANTAGVDPGLMVKIAGFESRGFNPDARPISSHPEKNNVRQFDGVMAISTGHGYGQFLNGTWQEMINRYGEQYGVEGASTMTRAQANAPELRTNLDLQAAMLAEFTRENMDRVRHVAGSNPDANFYAAHNLGSTGGVRFLEALRDHPNDPVSAHVESRDVIDKNKSLYVDHGRVLTVSEAYERMGQQLAKYQQYADQVAGLAQPAQAQNQTPAQPHPQTHAPADPMADGRLQRNERGEAVRALQQDLATLGVQFHDSHGRPIGPTGFYGAQTEAAVRDFQTGHQLPPTGIADDATRQAIGTAAREHTQAQPTPADPAAQPQPQPAQPQAQPQAQPVQGAQSFDDTMRTMLPSQNGTDPHVTSHFGHRMLHGHDDSHGGVDFNYTGGQSGRNLEHPVLRSPVSGTVEYGDGQGQYGTVKIRDDQGNLHEILHMDSRSVRVTDPPTRIEAGDPIGTMGGRGPDGPGHYPQHVHYQIRDPQGHLTDPEAFWNNRQRTQDQAPPAPAQPDTHSHAAPPQPSASTPPAPVQPDTHSHAAPPQPSASTPPAPGESHHGRASHDHMAHGRSEAMADGVLRRGETAPEVGQYQRVLADLGYRGLDGKPLAVDNKFGPHTEHATREFQRDHGIEQIGVIGPKTRAAVDEAGRELVTHPDNPNNRTFRQTLEKVHEAENARHLPHGEHSRNLAGALTVEAVRERMTQIDRVDLSRDGSMARAVQFSAMGDQPELNRNTDGVATRQAVQQPIRESSEQTAQVAQNVAVQQAQERQQSQQSPIAQGAR